MSKDCCGCCGNKKKKEHVAKLYTSDICSEGLPKPKPPPNLKVEFENTEEEEEIPEGEKEPTIASSWQKLTPEEIMLLLDSLDQRGSNKMEVLKSINDKRKYRVIKLCNDLTALLISDPIKADVADDDLELEEENEVVAVVDDDICDAEPEKVAKIEIKPKVNLCPEKKSAASLCIGIGSFADPPDIPGFAHFLEHMVFMGSEKYPEENDLDDFLSRHGGESNAWTDSERTTFYFDIHKKYFNKALDMFANFFISPLMLKDSVDREMQAVDSEFQMSKTDDRERVNQLIGSTAAAAHPAKNLMCGNLLTLKTYPEKNGINVYDKLRAFFEEHYGACYMTLAVQSQESLDDLQKLVTDTFSAIPSKYTSCDQKPKPAYLNLKDPYETKEFRKFYRVIPTEDNHKLEITWALKPVIKQYREKPLEYLSALIGYEGKGSILSYLKKRFWAVELSAGNSGSGFDQNLSWSTFCVNVTLTECGLQNVYEVMTAIFQYILRLQIEGPQPWFYLELQQIEACKFRWKEQSDPVEYVESVAEGMQLYPPEHYLMGKHLFMKYDEKLIQECTDAMQPSLANIVVMSKSFEKQGLCNLEEPWFGTKYGVTDVEFGWLVAWSDMDCIRELHFPTPNPYVVTDFTLENVKNPMKLPYRVLDYTGCRMWFKQDTKFNVPKGYIYLNLQSPIVCRAVECATLLQLFVNILLHTLDELVYPAVMAGYEYCVEETLTGVVVQLSGFTQKLPMLLKTIVDHIAEFDFTEEVFNIVAEQQKKNYYNEMLTPFNLAKTLRFALLEPCNQPSFERYNVMKTLTPANLRNFVDKYRKNLFFEGFMMGNFTPEKVASLSDYVQFKLNSTLTRDQITKRRLLEVPPGYTCCRVLSVNENDTNCCVTNYYQAVPGTLHNICLNEMLATRMHEPCFDKLRTKEQLGYSVYCRPLVTNGILGLAITVESQSSKVELDCVDEKITEFLEEFRETLEQMTDAQFKKLVKSMITDKEIEDTHMGEEADRYWRQIVDHFYVFNHLEKEIAVLKKLSLNDLKKWAKHYLDKNPKKLSLQVYGRPLALGSTDDKFKELTFLSDDLPNVNFILDIEQTKKTLKVLPHTLITS